MPGRNRNANTETPAENTENTSVVTETPAADVAENPAPRKRGRPLGSKNKPRNPEIESVIFSLNELQEMSEMLANAIANLPARADVRSFLKEDAPESVVELVDREQNRAWHARHDFLIGMLQGTATAIENIESRL